MEGELEAGSYVLRTGKSSGHTSFCAGRLNWGCKHRCQQRCELELTVVPPRRLAVGADMIPWSSGKGWLAAKNHPRFPQGKTMDESRERGGAGSVLPGTCCLWRPGRFGRQVRGSACKCVINYKCLINSGDKSRQAALWGPLQCLLGVSLQPWT